MATVNDPIVLSSLFYVHLRMPTNAVTHIQCSFVHHVTLLVNRTI